MKIYFRTLLLPLLAMPLLAVAAGAQDNYLLNVKWITSAPEEQIVSYLARTPDINEVNPRNGATPLLTLLDHRGNRSSGNRLLPLYLEAGADPNQPYGKNRERINRQWVGHSPLDRAISWGAEEAVRILIEAGADVNQVQPNGRTPLHSATINPTVKSVPMTRMLLAAGADPNFRDRSKGIARGATPLYNAVLHPSRKVELARLLLAAGADPNIPDYKNRMTPLIEAVIEPAKVEVVKLLLEYGADPTIPDAEGTSALYFVSGKPHPSFTRDHSHPELYTLMLEHMDPMSDKYVLPCYRVQRSDTRLSIIAEKALGDPARWPEIATLNKLSKENPYRAGDCLKLPVE